MNDQDQSVTVEEQNLPDTTLVSEQKDMGETQEAETQVESTEETETQTTEGETIDAPKKGYSARVQELANKARSAEDKVKSLEERIAELTGSVEPQTDFSQYSPQVEPGSEVSPDQYRTDVLRTAESMVTLKLKQSEAVNRINSESSESMRKYPELDPSSDSFNKELSESITDAVEAHVKVNPYSASVSKFVDKLMKPYKGAVDKEVGKAAENIAKQVSAAALKPTNVSRPEKNASEKSIAELEAELGIVQA